MQAYYNIHNLIESVQRCIYLSASLPSPFNCAHFYVFICCIFAKDGNFINLGVNPLEQITLLAIFVQLLLELLFKMILFPATLLVFILFASVQVLDTNYFFRQLIACHN